jgi:hypothetical protein
VGNRNSKASLVALVAYLLKGREKTMSDAPERIWARYLKWTSPYNGERGLIVDNKLGPDLREYVPTDLVQSQIDAAVAAEREACAEDVWHECYPSTNQGALSEKQLAEADTTECAIKAIRARANTEAQAALERVKREAWNEALDAASEYLKTVYGNSPLSHPVDRKRILELMEDHSDE